MQCQRRKKMDVVERFGGKCQICGYDRCINALEFHHLDNKKESPSYVIMRWSWERARAELEKCIMLCANCHREVHYTERDVTPLVSPVAWRVHVCPVCDKTYDTKNKKQTFCSQTCAKRYQSKPGKPPKEKLRHLIRTIPQRTIATMLHVAQSTIRKWCQGYGIDIAEGCRSHRNPALLARKQEKLNKPKGIFTKRKLSLEQAKAACLALQRGEESLRTIAKRYGVHHSTLIDIRRGRSYVELKNEFPDLIRERPEQPSP